MNILLSLNKWFFQKLAPHELINIIEYSDISNIIKGAEICFDHKNSNEIEYVTKLAELFYDSSHILQIHAYDVYSQDDDDIIKALNCYNDLADHMRMKIKLTIHPAEGRDLTGSIAQTLKTAGSILEQIEKNGLSLDLLIENLNAHCALDKKLFRCNIPQIYSVIEAYPGLGLTFDAGHYVYDHGNDYLLFDHNHAGRIKNIHLHDIDSCGNDHQPFYYDRLDLEKFFALLKTAVYPHAIVLEIAAENLNGSGTDEVIKEYISQAEKIYAYIKE